MRGTGVRVAGLRRRMARDLSDAMALERAASRA
jgi:hypothetical protein